MFGFELQVSDNVFMNGVGEREVAFEHVNKLLTLEGDETSFPNASSEFEFVTKPCNNADEAMRAITDAQALARELAKISTEGQNQFGPATHSDNGSWTKNCTVRVSDHEFHAQAQVTVGVSLRKLAGFIETLLGSTQQEQDAASVAACLEASVKDRTNATEELRGFLAACALFLIRAIPPLEIYTLLATGVPFDPNKRDWHLFDFRDSQYIRGLTLRADGFPTSFLRDGGCYPLPVCVDSPKSLFNLLHRTDFHSMFLALEEPDRKFLRATAIEKIWPLLVGSAAEADSTYLFPTPYRCDPDAGDNDTQRRIDNLNQIKDRPQWLVSGQHTQVRWRLADRGPSVADWWSSVLNGDPARAFDGGNLPKDVASPPPGWRGRAPQLLSRFPQPAEDKKNYYGMGSFPMDDSSAPHLAVFEIRNLMSDTAVVKLCDQTGLIPVDNWDKLVKLVVGKYVLDA